ncbi:uncharacterized protein LOC125486001 [Rhincodon typus]|uniref:uncharacterized protein LOC125486001 n=1 Tax=Rhincodon typus TaxID=259920 RepID=UPI0020303035|nr:uncharacterized protein LOC125486001 [Rhincodon typus]
MHCSSSRIKAMSSTTSEDRDCRQLGSPTLPWWLILPIAESREYLLSLQSSFYSWLCQVGSCREDRMSGESAVSPVPAASTRTTSFKGASPSSKYVKLNVGGALYYTTMQTLTKQDTMLKAMFSGRMEVLTDSEGWILIDRCGKHFGAVLNYLRDGAVPLPETNREIEELLAEAKYYLVQGLVEECQAALQYLQYFSIAWYRFGLKLIVPTNAFIKQKQYGCVGGVTRISQFWVTMGKEECDPRRRQEDFLLFAVRNLITGKGLVGGFA